MNSTTILEIENKKYVEIHPIEYSSKLWNIFCKVIKEPKAQYPSNEINFNTHDNNIPIHYKLLINHEVDTNSSSYTLLKELTI